MMTYPHRPVLKLQNRFLNLPRKGHGDLPTSLLRNECTTNLGNDSLIICVMGWMGCLFSSKKSRCVLDIISVQPFTYTYTFDAQ